MKKLKIFLNGLIYENPTLVIFLGMCPALGTTDTIEHAIYMSLCVLAVLLLSNVIISLIRKIVPNVRRLSGSGIVHLADRRQLHHSRTRRILCQ